MCLHPINDRFEIRIADRDIVVWKVLETYPTLKNKPGKTLYSPFYGAIYHPGRTKRSPIWITYGVIDEGLHAFITRDAHDAVDLLARGEKLRRIYPAVIPAGSKFTVGRWYEIASTALIVYDTMKDLEKVHGKVAEPVQQQDAGTLFSSVNVNGWASMKFR